jgi:hypothetical protein
VLKCLNTSISHPNRSTPADMFFNTIRKQRSPTRSIPIPYSVAENGRFLSVAAIPTDLLYFHAA